MSLPSRPEVVVVGAGLAGLSGARRNTAVGVDMVVLEACGRVGGRIATVPRALPAAPPPPGLRRPVRLGDRRYVAWDHRDTPPTQGATVSATAVLRVRQRRAAA
jgi:flavin-dependent dehydrogenase